MYTATHEYKTMCLFVHIKEKFEMICHFYCCYGGDMNFGDRHKSAPCLIQLYLRGNISMESLRAMFKKIAYMSIVIVFQHITK